MTIKNQQPQKVDHDVASLGIATVLFFFSLVLCAVGATLAVAVTPWLWILVVLGVVFFFGGLGKLWIPFAQQQKASKS